MAGKGGGAGTAAGAQGAGKAMSDLEGLKAKFPEAVVSDKVKEAGLRSKIVAAAKPQFRANAIKQWQDKHWIMNKLVGVDHNFVTILDLCLAKVQ
jgi:hypothetical protein